MGRLFGTDGVRGIANRDLSTQRAAEIGRALAEVIRQEHRLASAADPASMTLEQMQQALLEYRKTKK